MLRLRILLAVAALCACCGGTAQATTTPSPTTSTTVQVAAPGPCADYTALEGGHGTPARRAWFVRLNGHQYAELRARCAYGWVGAEWRCLDQLWAEESSWKPTAGHPAASYGIPQAYPGTKMAAAGADWRTNPRVQVRWGLQYIATRYQRPTRASMQGTPCHAGY